MLRLSYKTVTHESKSLEVCSFQFTSWITIVNDFLRWKFPGPENYVMTINGIDNSVLLPLFSYSIFGVNSRFIIH